MRALLAAMAVLLWAGCYDFDADLEACRSPGGRCESAAAPPADAGTEPEKGEPVVGLSAGLDFSCARHVDGTVSCWGQNDEGQLGQGTVGAPIRQPVQVPELSGAVAIASGYDHTCAIVDEGRVKCWGTNVSGQLGSGEATLGGVPRPTDVEGLTGVTKLALGFGHSCALLEDGTVRCWGANVSGQLGNGTSGENGLSPTPVCASDGAGAPCPPLEDVTDLSAGRAHTCVSLSNKTVRCWGGNSVRQLGNESTTGATPLPVEVAGAGLAESVAAGGSVSCALITTNQANCWGRNSDGQLGRGTAVERSSATPMPVCNNAECTTTLGSVGALGIGEEHVCAISGGAVRCWGSNAFGVLGDGTHSPIHYAGTTPIASGAGALVAGSHHTCALLADGSVQCWGSNESGQIGSGSDESEVLTPTTPAW